MMVPRLHEPLSEHDSVRALMVGRHPLVLAALAEHLHGPPLNVRVEFTTRSDEVVDRVRKRPYDLVFCELRAQPIPGAEVTAGLTELGSGPRVVLLADPEDRSLIVNSLDCGALGFFTNDASPEEFVEGIRAVLGGHFAVGTSLARPALSRFARHDESAGDGHLSQLSPTERRILLMVAQAQQIPAIARTCGISQKTVRNHLANIYRKLGLRNRPEAVLWSARMGLVKTPLD